MGHAMPPLPQPGQDTRANSESCLLLLLLSPRAGLVAGRTVPCKARLRAVQQLPLALCAAKGASLLQQMTILTLMALRGCHAMLSAVPVEWLSRRVCHWGRCIGPV